MRKGYITVYLSLTLAVMVSLVLTLVEGARISATRMTTSCVADIGINSTLSEFNRELFDRYDLLFVDMTYGAGSGSIASVESRLNYYLRQNLDNGTPAMSRDLLGLRLASCTVEEYSLATDEGAEPILRQVSDYMNTTLKGVLTSGLDDLSGNLSSAGFDYNVDAKRAEVEAQLSDVELPVIINDKGEEEEIPLNNPADAVNALRGAGILGVVLSDTSSVSKITISSGEYASNRSLVHGNGLSSEERQYGKAAGHLTYDEYLFDKMGYYGHPRDNSLLQYQIEYVIKNKDSDWDNLESVCWNIVAWREAINFVYLMADSAKQSEAELVASAVAIVAFNPELLDPIKWSILLAWAYLESLQDMKILLEGGGVPVVKNASTWHTSLSSILHPRSALRSYPGQPGPGYGDYLKTMLLMTSFSKVKIKSLDIMEMDIRLTPGNACFKMDYCLNSFLVNIATKSTHGHSNSVQRRNGYYYA